MLPRVPAGWKDDVNFDYDSFEARWCIQQVKQKKVSASKKRKAPESDTDDYDCVDLSRPQKISRNKSDNVEKKIIDDLRTFYMTHSSDLYNAKGDKIALSDIYGVDIVGLKQIWNQTTLKYIEKIAESDECECSFNIADGRVSVCPKVVANLRKKLKFAETSTQTLLPHVFQDIDAVSCDTDSSWFCDLARHTNGKFRLKITRSLAGLSDRGQCKTDFAYLN